MWTPCVAFQLAADTPEPPGPTGAHAGSPRSPGSPPERCWTPFVICRLKAEGHEFAAGQPRQRLHAAVEGDPRSRSAELLPSAARPGLGWVSLGVGRAVPAPRPRTRPHAPADDAETALGVMAEAIGQTGRPFPNICLVVVRRAMAAPGPGLEPEVTTLVDLSHASGSRRKRSGDITCPSTPPQGRPRPWRGRRRVLARRSWTAIPGPGPTAPTLPPLVVGRHGQTSPTMRQQGRPRGSTRRPLRRAGRRRRRAGCSLSETPTQQPIGVLGNGRPATGIPVAEEALALPSIDDPAVRGHLLCRPAGAGLLPQAARGVSAPGPHQERRCRDGHDECWGTRCALHRPCGPRPGSDLPGAQRNDPGWVLHCPWSRRPCGGVQIGRLRRARRPGSRRGPSALRRPASAPRGTRRRSRRTSRRCPRCRRGVETPTG